MIFRIIKKEPEIYCPDSIHVDGFGGTDIYAGLAVNAHILIHFCLLVFHGDCRCRAFAHTGFASGTLFEINDSYQLFHSIVYVLHKTKKRVSIEYYRLYST